MSFELPDPHRDEDSPADNAAAIRELKAKLALSRNLYDELYAQTEQLRVENARLRARLGESL